MILAWGIKVLAVFVRINVLTYFLKMDVEKIKTQTLGKT